MQKQSFSLENVHCSACEAKVIKILTQLEAVQDVSVNVLRKTMQVTFSDEKLGVAGIVSAMQQAGFSATPTRFTAHAEKEENMQQETTGALPEENADISDKTVENSAPFTEQAFMLSRAHCASCEGKIRTALLSLEGIKEARVNTLSKSIVVQYDASVIAPPAIEEHFSGGKYAMSAVEKTALPPLIPCISNVKQKKIPKHTTLPIATEPEHSADTSESEEADTALVKEAESVSEKKKLQRQEFTIGNVHCTACEAKVEKLLLAMQGIEAVAVNVLRKTMFVTFDSAQMAVHDISKAMEGAGFTATACKGVLEPAQSLPLPKANFAQAGEDASKAMLSQPKQLQEMVFSSPGATLGEPSQKDEESALTAVQMTLLTQDAVVEEESEKSTAKVKIGPKFWDKLPLSLLASLFFASVLMYVAMAPMFTLPLPLFLSMKANPLLWAAAQCVLTLPILCIHRRIFTSGLRALRYGSPNMDSLVGLGSATAASFGVYALVRMYMAQHAGDTVTVEHFANNLYFDSSGMILALIGLGKHFEFKARERTGSAIDALMRLTPPTAICLKDGEEVTIATDQVQKDDVLVVYAGQSLAADGIIIQGHAFIDTSAITGESLPQEKKQGDAVIGATICQSGYFHMQVTKAGAESTLAHIIELVESATASKAPIARLADRISAIFVPIIIIIALISFGTWLWLGAGLEFALSIAISVLVISCPCALGLATPTAIMVGMGMGAEHGILFKSAAAIERMQSIDTVVLDKTGTLTHGKPVVTDVYPCTAQEAAPAGEMGQQLGLLDIPNKNEATPISEQEDSASSPIAFDMPQEAISEEALLYFAASIERLSEHPLGQAIVQEAKKQNIALASAESYSNFKQMPGLGIMAEQDGKRILAGNARLLAKENILNPLMDKEKELARQGKTVLYFAKDQTFLGLIAMADTVKESSKNAVQDLKKLGLTVLMLTGDNALTAKAVQEHVDIENILAEVLPHEKEEKVRQLQAAGHKVIMVGDGINDAPALARAQVGIAVGQGTDIALQSSDIVLMQSDVSHVAQALKLSKAVMRTIKQNLFWAFAYNSILIPVAVGLFYAPFGLTLNPMLAAASMSLSSLTVVSNALRLRMQRKKIF